MRIPGVPYVQGRNNYEDSDGRKYGIAIHNTSNDASDTQEASYATRRTDGTSSHLYVDHDSVTQSLDTAARAGHAGSWQGNDHAISVEITGANGWTRDRWLRSVAWDKLGAALAHVIRHHWPDGSFKVRRATVTEMKSNPKVKAFYGHDDMRRAWDGTTHTDPGPNFPWDRLFQAVNNALNPPKKEPSMDLKEIAHAVNDFRWPADGKTLYSHSRDAADAARKLLEGQAVILAELKAIAGRDWVDENAIIAGVLAGLSGRDIGDAADALAAVFGDRVGELAAALVSRIPAES